MRFPYFCLCSRYLLLAAVMAISSIVTGNARQYQAIFSSRPPRITLDFTNSRIIDIFSEITRQTDLNFLYQDDILLRVKPLTLHIKDEPLEKVLAEISRQTGLIFRQTDNTIAVRPGEPSRTIGGRVADNNGEPLPGVNVLIKGTAKGTVTDSNGNYSLTAPGEQSVLVFSYMGYATQEIPVGIRTVIDATMKENVRKLGDVVVVGYDMQKKDALTGSVSVIPGSLLANRPVASLSSALSGLAAGMSVQQISGSPGGNGADILIRGTGTFDNNKTGPMVIIDGAPGMIDFVNPDDVESISVLKDAASAAIYGARAANGVILINTRKGVPGASPRVTYTGIFSSERSSDRYNFMTDYADYMEIINRAQRSVGANECFSRGSIDAWRAASKNPDGIDNPWGIPNRLAYPNTDWNKASFQNSFYQKHNLSVVGGSHAGNCMLSFNYVDDPGLMENTGIKQYRFRINMETSPFKFLKIGTKTFALKQDKQVIEESGLQISIQNLIPGMTPFYDGKYGGPENPEQQTMFQYDPNLLNAVNSMQGTRATRMVNTGWYAEANIFKGFTAEGRFNYQYYNSEEDAVYNYGGVGLYSFRTGMLVRPGGDPADAQVWNDESGTHSYTATAILRYAGDFGGHRIGALAGYEQYEYQTKSLYVERVGLIDPLITEIGSAEENKTISGSHYDEAMISYFGRVNYSRRNKYLFEANLRYDGSSHFAPGNRWGMFPSFSAAWRISDEPFMHGIARAVSDLKLRASWGQLGNVTSGYYDWQSTYGETRYSFGGKNTAGLAQNKIANPSLQWETTTITDIGLDASLFDKRLGLVVDFYNRLTSGILTSPATYLTLGMANPATKNTADMRNRGFEVTLSRTDRSGDFNWSVSANFSYNRNRVVSYLGKLREGWTESDGNRVYRTNIGQVANIGGVFRPATLLEDHLYEEYYMYTTHKGTGVYRDAGGAVDPRGGPRDGMIRTPEDLQWVRDMQAAGYSFRNNLVDKKNMWYGEQILADLNGDGIYGNTYDRHFTGKSQSAKYTYGLDLSAAWKGWHVYMLWTGNAGMHSLMYETGINSSRTSSGTSVSATAFSDFYYYNEADPADPANNTGARYPRLKSDNSLTYFINDTYLYNASYIKLKSLRIGYDFPKRWLGKIYVAKLCIFLAGENLAIITRFPVLDPETAVREYDFYRFYPMARHYSAGITISF